MNDLNYTVKVSEVQLLCFAILLTPKPISVGNQCSTICLETKRTTSGFTSEVYGNLVQQINSVGYKKG